MARERKTSDIDVSATKASLWARLPPGLVADIHSRKSEPDLSSSLRLLAKHGPCAHRCRDCGLVQSLVTLCDYEASAPRSASGEGKQVHELGEVCRKALRQLSRFRSVRNQLKLWLATLDRKHKAMAPLGSRWQHDHAALCERPRRIADALDVLFAELPDFRRTMPLALGPHALRQEAGRKQRATITAQLDDLLTYNGYSAAESAEIINDGNGGDLRTRKDRARKRRGRAKREGRSL